jgi:transposase
MKSPVASVLPLRAEGAPPTRIGVGIDASRYGHHAVFLREDLQPAATELSFAESAAGYAQFRERLEKIVQKSAGPVQVTIRLDAAGQYADNLLHFLQQLVLPGTSFTISCGDPQRNKNYRAALFGPQKSDPVEALAMARYALSEQPSSSAILSLEQRLLRQLAARLQAVVRQQTRLINQLHHLLALVFPELALLTKDITVGWVLELLHRYPTAQCLAKASEAEVADIPYLPHAHIAELLAHARASIASLSGPAAEELVRDQVRQLRDGRARRKRLENSLISAYRGLPVPNHLHTIPGIGEVTAAVLTAFIADIRRFATPGKLVAYFGALPIEVSSGVDRDGRSRGPKRYVMSRRGNDLVRRYLWMAALSAVTCNAPVRALYARIVARHPDHKSIAIGHGMRKLLHLAFAIWKTNTPFDPARCGGAAPGGTAPAVADEPAPDTKQAAGLTPEVKPAVKEVTTACASKIAVSPKPQQVFVDFAHVKRQLPIERVLDQLGLTAKLRGSGPQRRCACPIHRGDARGRTFSVNLAENVFHCHDPSCNQQGDAIDLWAALHHLNLRDAALDLVQTFHLDPAPRTDAAEKRHG